MPDLGINEGPCVCERRQNEPHPAWCPFPEVIAEHRTDLWMLREDASPHPTDEMLQRCNRRALIAWIRQGRML